MSIVLAIRSELCSEARIKQREHVAVSMGEDRRIWAPSLQAL